MRRSRWVVSKLLKRIVKSPASAFSVALNASAFPAPAICEKSSMVMTSSVPSRCAGTVTFWF